MHDAGLMSGQSTSAGRPLERAIVREAAQWLSCLHGGAQTTPEELAACARWRAADPEHERAWQHAQHINAKFGLIPPDIGVVTLGRSVRTDRRAAIKTLMLLMTAVPAGYVAYQVTPWGIWTADYRTAAGETRTIDLDDGTRVQLGTASAIDVVYTAQERLLILREGEIVVTTGRDTQHRTQTYRPFIVQAKHGRVRAIGTQFHVRQDDRRPDRTYVAVLQGAVDIRPRQASHTGMILHAGQQTSFSVTDIASPEAVNAHATDWTRGMLFANSMRLADFLAELGRYRPGVLRCDPDVADLLITGVFRLDQTDRVLAALPETLPVKVTYRTRYWVTVLTPDKG